MRGWLKIEQPHVALYNGDGVQPEPLNVSKLFALVNVKFDAWDETECLLCAKGVPINTDVGNGVEFLARRK